MNKKKTIILVILFVAIAGFMVAPASAASKTVKIIDKNTWKYIGKGQSLRTSYYKKYLDISVWNKYEYDSTSCLATKAKVYCKNSKGNILTKNYKANKYGVICKTIPKG